MSAAPNLVQKAGQKQSQTVTFTAQMREAIELLELSNLDLQAHVSQKIMENPFLEDGGQSGEQDNDHGSDQDREYQDREHAHQLDYQNDNQCDSDKANEENPDRSTSKTTENTNQNSDSYDDHVHTTIDHLDADQKQSRELYNEMDSDDYSNMWTSDRRLSARDDRFNNTPNALSQFDYIADTSVTLRDHIHSQINTDISSKIDRFIASVLLDHLDETGYFTADCKDIAAKLDVEDTHVQRVLEKLKQCDPVGVFAQSLKECLELQLQEQGLLNEKTQSVLMYIDLFADAKIEALLKKTGCTLEELKTILATLKRLNPKPGLTFVTDPLQIVVPDVYVRPSVDQTHWVISLNAETLPRVLVTKDYKIRANLDLKKDKELKRYYQERMAEANWLVRSLDQRAQNILKIVEEIIKQQDGFLHHGVTHLKPLTLKQVAAAVEVHESTVSRITQNKFLHCPRGVFELRYFFSSCITNAWTGEDQSARQIQNKIEHIVKSENPEKPLSDDAIVLKLSDYNLDAARRTVAKYRELLSIPSSYERKRRYKQNL